MKRLHILLGCFAAVFGLSTLNGGDFACSEYASRTRWKWHGCPVRGSTRRDPLVRPYTFNDAENALKMSVGLTPSKPSYDVSGEQPSTGPDGAVTARECASDRQAGRPGLEGWSDATAECSAHDRTTGGGYSESWRSAHDRTTGGGYSESWRSAHDRTTGGGYSESSLPPTTERQAAAIPNPGTPPTTEPRLVVIPNLTGRSSEEAQGLLLSLGLSSRLGEGTQSPPSDADRGKVFKQSPPAGTKLAKSETVTIEIYPRAVSPPPKPRVPDLAGMTKDEAELAIRNLGLTPHIGAGKRPAPADTNVGQVYAQSPSAGTEVSPGDDVMAVIHPRQASAAVPNLIGLGKDQAAAAVRNLGLVPQIGIGNREPAADDNAGPRLQAVPAGRHKTGPRRNRDADHFSAPPRGRSSRGARPLFDLPSRRRTTVPRSRPLFNFPSRRRTAVPRSRPLFQLPEPPPDSRPEEPPPVHPSELPPDNGPEEPPPVQPSEPPPDNRPEEPPPRKLSPREGRTRSRCIA